MAEFFVFITLQLDEGKCSELNWFVSREYATSTIWIMFM